MLRIEFCRGVAAHSDSVWAREAGLVQVSLEQRNTSTEKNNQLRTKVRASRAAQVRKKLRSRSVDIVKAGLAGLHNR